MATCRELLATHPLGERYAGTAWVQAPTSLTDLSSAHDALLVDLFCYRCSDGILVLALGDRHTESVTEWLNRVDKLGNSVSTLCATFAAGALQPPETDACHLVFEDESLTPGILGWLLDKPEFCLFVHPHDRSIHALAPASVALNTLQMSGLRPKVTPALEFLQRITATPRPHRACRSYDPFGAQVGEVTGRTYVALQEKLNSVERAWEQATRRTAPQELAAIRESCQARVDWTKRLTQMAREKRDLIPSLVASVDMLAGVLSQCFSVCDDLEQKLSDYLDPSTRSTLVVSYSSTARRMILDATGRFANEVVWRAGLNHAVKIVPAFGDSFMLMPLWSALGLSGASQPRPVPGTAMVNLPRACELRLGSVPVIAHEIMHLLVEQKGPGLIEEFLAKAGDFAGIDDLMQDLATSAARIGESSAEHTTGAYRVRAWATELLCDLLACVVCGPAYFYSVARFAAGTLSDFIRPSRLTQTDLPFSKRCNTCLRVLRGLGFEMSFYSEFLFTDLVTAPESFCRWLQENVARPYSTSEQSARLDTCQRALSEGKLSDADPVSLLNALWQGVVRGSPYINEIALLMSMADSSIGQNERAVN